MSPRPSVLACSRAALLLAALGGPAVAAAELDLTDAVVVAAPGLSGPEKQAVRMLVEEVGCRSWADWKVTEELPPAGRPCILVGNADAASKKLGGKRPPPIPSEGYDISASSSVVRVLSDDERGTLFGVGRLLRELRIRRDKVTLPADFSARSAPKTALRGHQIGYRPKTNSYDGWTAAMWEQYIRDLAVFGCNAIEIIPPRSDDAADSPLFPKPPLRMMTEVSRIAASYGLEVWVWYPALDKDYSDPKSVAFALDEWGAVFKALPRVDAVFVPGGDPGHTPPKALFPLLEKQAANLRKHHPKAGMWVSPQGFNEAWMSDFLALLKAEPAWLAGVVHGPQVRLSIPALRAAVPSRYPIRDYPDITHSRTCQYAVPDWDLAFALTIAREGCNPRPSAMKAIFNHARPHTAGFITYSEGCHDDVNKAVWSALGWDDKADLREVLRQYGRYFVSPALADRFADGQFALEKNWTGPAMENKGIDETLRLFRAMERDAGPREKLSWRFQQALYRAYYDAYVRARLRHEVGATDAARAKLREAKLLGSLKAMAAAEEILDRAAKETPASDLRTRAAELAEALFQSVRAQLSVKKYHAIAVGRGASLDTIDAPLSDAAWLRAEIASARKLTGEPARLARLDACLNREDPGPGGFYDDLGDPRRQPRLVRGPAWEKDPGYYASPHSTVSRSGVPPASPRAWWTHAQTHYDTPLRMRYTGLDRAASYRVRVVYSQPEGREVRLMTGGGHEVHGWMSKPLQPLEFDVPAAATASGELALSWAQEPGQTGAGRGCQVAEVWLLKARGGK